MNETPLIQRYLQLRSEFIGYLYAITRDADLAEEVYQNSAIVILKRDHDAEVIRNFRAWAKEVVRRQALLAIRERERSSKLTRVIAPELLDVVSTAFFEDKSDRSVVLDESRALKQCLADLPAEKLQLIALRYENDASFDEISKQANASASAVQRSLSRIRKLLYRCVRKRIRLAEGLI